MIVNKFMLVLLGFWLTNVQATSTPSSPYYTVGVVEYEQSTISNPEKQLKMNLQGYIELLKSYVQNRSDGSKIDIIVFPESTLNSYETAVKVPLPNPNIELCGQVNLVPQLLSQLSCWADEFKKYMLFNIVEMESCTAEAKRNATSDGVRECPADGFFRYNTNIVFDRNGALIARYRKWNLFMENDLSQTLQPEFSTFSTDFGVNFGTFTCFDILFYYPAHKLVGGITDFLHPSKWYSELPFLTANQIQHGWAYANDVNLMVSGASYPQNGTTGSGVFAARNGVLESGMMASPTSILYTVEVPKHHHNYELPMKPVSNPKQVPERLLGLNVLRDPNLDSYANYLLSSTDLKNIEHRLCYKEFCCDFKIERKSFDSSAGQHESYSYRLVAFAGQRSYFGTKKTSWLKTCAVVACTDNKSISSCGRIFAENIGYGNLNYFQNIEIRGEFQPQKELLIMPSTVDQMFRPLYRTQFNFSTEDMSSEWKIAATMKLLKPNSDLLTFGIYANYYDEFSNGTKISSTTWILMISLICIVFMKY